MHTLAADMRPAKIAHDQTNASVTTTRRALLGTATAAAIVGIALPASAAEPAAASPSLRALIATVQAAVRIADAHDRNVLGPVEAQRNEAVAAAKASLPHTTVDAGESLSGERIVWTTANPANVTVARFRVSAAKSGATLPPDHVAAARKLLAAHLRRERAIDTARRSCGIAPLVERSNALCDEIADAEHAVAAFPARTPADLATKLAFMVERRLGDGMDWLSELLADARRITGEIA